MVFRNNAGKLGAGFISVCLETRWPGHLGGFHVPGCYCRVLFFKVEGSFLRQRTEKRGLGDMGIVLLYTKLDLVLL